MADEERSRHARRAAERALIRVVHHYGARPEFVVLGGLVPDLLCSASNQLHAGTTDVDVQVDMEIACGAVNTRRLENALRNAEFEPDGEREWRWVTDGPGPKSVVKFELLADLDDQPAQVTISFDGCERLGAVNLRGTGFATQDHEVRILRMFNAGQEQTAEINIAGLAGFLLAKSAAAHSRRKPKDWYDIAFVLLNNDRGGPVAAGRAVVERFGDQLVGGVRTALDDLAANFADTDGQGPQAFIEQTLINHPDSHPRQLASDSVLAMRRFQRIVTAG